MRQHSIKATYLIHKTLVDDTDFIKLIPEINIWPVVVKADQAYPYLVIKRDSIQTNNGTKDFWPDVITFSIRIFSDDWDQTVDIADAARFLLENRIIQDDVLRMERITLISSSEDWVGDAYEQTLVFRAEVVAPIITN